MLYVLENIVQSYGEHRALDMRHLPPLHIEHGSVVALTGPNGAGKSTLLRILAFLEAPSSGSISFHTKHGICTYKSPQDKKTKQQKRVPCAQARLHCTLLLQEPYLFKTSVLENVCYGLRIRGIKEGLREKAFFALETVGFKAQEVLQRPWYQLSGGEKQRVALAARLVLEPLALLLDEPTAHTDVACSEAIHEAVRTVASRGTTVIVSSHDKHWLESLQATYIHLGTSA